MLGRGLLFATGAPAASAAYVLLHTPTTAPSPDARFEANRCATRDEGLARLRADGFATVPGVDCARLASTLDSRRRRQKAVEVSKGRLHYDLVHSRHRDDADLQRSIEALAGPLRDMAEAYCETRRVKLTQVQFLDSLPGSAAQIWHSDNAARGLTFMLPLEAIRCDMGPTEVLPRSHASWAAFPTTRALSCGPVETGDALVFDARLLHRGGANGSRARRRVLVLRYDVSDPPGTGLLGTALRRVVAHAWAQLSDLS